MRDGSRTSDYQFELPPELIAQEPLARRDASRLMTVTRADQSIAHRRFTDLPQLFRPGDLLVVNRSRVIRARLLGQRSNGASAEVMLLRQIAGEKWEAMVHPGGKLKSGRTVRVADDLEIEILETTDRRTRIVALHTPLGPDRAIETYGHVPLPPYIRRVDEPADAERYQTVFAREPGSVAAPTAGLHFTHDLLNELRGRGVTTAEVVLHVGAGTFKPVVAENPADHVMHEEWFSIPPETADAVAAARAGGGRVIGVGTTAARALESAAVEGRLVKTGNAETRIFIRPPYRWRVVDALLTNFHLPGSTLIMLVAAMAGLELTLRAYAEAVRERYRFFSYGDAMLVI